MWINDHLWDLGGGGDKCVGLRALILKNPSYYNKPFDGFNQMIASPRFLETNSNLDRFIV